MKWDETGGTSGSLGKKRNEYRVLVGKSEGKKQFGIPRFGLEDGIKLDLKKNGTE